jgi:uncharacterized protein YbjT (DUF2867 family)
METHTHTNQNILVIAASGKTGRRVTALLEARGVTVRRGSRSGTPPFDWADRGSWGSALDGMDAAYIVYTPDIAVPSAPSDIAAFVELARERGLKKLVLLSGRIGEETPECERIVAESGLAWTVIRPGWFNQNFSEGEFLGMVEGGAITLPHPDVPEPYVDADDIAEVAVAALTEEGHDGEVYEVTGPEPLTYAQVAEQLSDAIGREIRYEEITPEQLWAGLASAGMPDELVEIMKYLFGVTASGVNAHVTDGVERALGRQPRSFAEYAARAAASGAWSRAQTEAPHA